MIKNKYNNTKTSNDNSVKTVSACLQKHRKN